MAPKPNIKKRAAVIKAKLADPDASMATIAERVGLAKASVWEAIADARARGLLPTDDETADFFMRGAVEESAKALKRSLAIHAEDLELAQKDVEIVSASRVDGAPMETLEHAVRSTRRNLANELAAVANRAVRIREVVLGPAAPKDQSAGATFNAPVQIVFNRSDKRPMAPIARETPQGTTQDA